MQSDQDILLTHLRQVDFSITTLWTGQFPIESV